MIVNHPFGVGAHRMRPFLDSTKPIVACPNADFVWMQHSGIFTVIPPDLLPIKIGNHIAVIRRARADGGVGGGEMWAVPDII